MNTLSHDVLRIPMTENTASTILRRPQVQAESGYSRSTIYLRMAQGLFPKPVQIGPRAVGWPAREIAALNEARIRGESEADLRVLVRTLEQSRRAVGR